MKEDKRSEDVYITTRESSKGELVSRLVRKLSLDNIISYAKRIQIKIKDILVEIDRKKAEWDLKKLQENFRNLRNQNNRESFFTEFRRKQHANV